jgi:hypothetical protein
MFTGFFVFLKIGIYWLLKWSYIYPLVHFGLVSKKKMPQIKKIYTD